MAVFIVYVAVVLYVFGLLNKKLFNFSGTKQIYEQFIYLFTMDPAIIAEYLNSLTEMELIAYNIAKSHLGSLFSLEKSNHFLEWLKLRGKPYAS
jgi:hypothetical protein